MIKHPDDNSPSKNIALLLGIIFIAFNLRPAITSVGPLIGFIREDTGISNGVAGLLTTIPLLAFALLSPFAPTIGQRLGKERTVFIGGIILTAGILVRATGLIPPLFLGTALAGAGIAICNVLLPGIVKEHFPTKVGLMTGVYTTSMVLWASAASGFSIPITNGFDLEWNTSLGTWVLLTLPALLFWLPQLKNKPNTVHSFDDETNQPSVWRSKLAWQVTFFMGLQSFLFYCLITWLPEILQARGIDASAAGWMLSIMQFIGFPLSFFIPVIADRLSNQKGIVIGISCLYFIGLGGLLMDGSFVLLAVSVFLFGLAQGGALSLSLTLLGLRAQSAKQASQLSGMAQSFGYLLAAIGPFSIGILFDMYHSWIPAIIIFLIVTAGMLWSGIGAGRNRYVFENSA
ncbi:CP family cyanate transporter-like MFS transporter [Salibacterium salarium]|uniref:CynX/NimT family MFS transporter n=1 Tax=Salibacterium salarium TaxID=284579 RepID=UPI0027856498|nr:MFS transporter [Salibacterium salarium]MDQ0300723.1 CP family cyanate transporter-like MFS transporter [Salibacterium salarium]